MFAWLYISHEPRNNTMKGNMKPHKKVNDALQQESLNRLIRDIIDSEEKLKYEKIILNTNLTSDKVLINNRVNKAGSTTLLKLMEALAKSVSERLFKFQVIYILF